MFRLAVILLTCLALGLAGCATEPTEAPPEAPAPPVTPAPVPLAKPVVKPPVPPATPSTPVVKIKPPAVTQYTNTSRPVIQFNAPPPVVSRPVLTWTSLNRWAPENGVGLPHRISNTPVVTYALGSAAGVLLLEIGSRDSYWNGTLIHLGFAPEMIDDQVFVHGLDLEKTLAL